jgi:hypothetical protein
LIGWDSTKKKPVVGTGTAVIPIGGGLTPVSLGIGDFTDIGGSVSEYQAESGKLYLVDLTGQGATTKYKVVAPDGAAEVVYAVQCKANTNTSYLLGMKGYGGTDKFYYDGAENTELDFAFSEMRCDFAWDSNDSHFLCGVSSAYINGTLSGGLTVSGPFNPSGGIVGSTTGIAAVSTQVGYFNSQVLARANAVTLVDSIAKTVLSYQPAAGRYLMSFVVAINHFAATQTFCQGGVSTTNNTLPSDDSGTKTAINPPGSVLVDSFMHGSTTVINTDGSTTYYLIARSGFSGLGGSNTAYGQINFIRI